MAKYEQGDMQIEDLPIVNGIYEAKIEQVINAHALLCVTAWLRSGLGKDELDHNWVNSSIRLIARNSAYTATLFCGILKKISIVQIQGRNAVRIEAKSYSVLMDSKLKMRSYQQESRTLGELAEILLEDSGGKYIWNSGRYRNQIGKFMMQYQESDWGFLQRLASYAGEVVFPDATLQNVRLYIGLPEEIKTEKLTAYTYKIKKGLARIPQKVDNNYTGGVLLGKRLEVSGIREDYEMGARLSFEGETWAVIGKQSELIDALWVHRYELCLPGECHTERMDNLRLPGTAITGSVKETGVSSNRLSLETDGPAESVQSWHVQPVYYVGKGKGYSGQPEKGDLQSLYFPTMREEDRYIISGADAGEDKITAIVDKNASRTPENKSRPQGEPPWLKSTGGGGASGAGGSGGASGGTTPEELPDTVSWSTPGSQSMTLDGSGITFACGGDSGLGLTGSGININTSGNLMLQGLGGDVSIGGSGKEIIMSGKLSVLLASGGSTIKLTPDEVEINGTETYLVSSENQPHEVVPESEVEALLADFAAAKKSMAPIYAADGRVIHREGFDEIIGSEDLYNFFMDKVYGHGDYANELGQPVLTIYDGWLGDVYGRTSAQKFSDYLFSLQGLHDVLDIVGLFFDPADALNALIYFIEKDYVNGALSLIGAIPFLGDMAAKGGKAVKKFTSMAIVELAVKGEKVLDRTISGINFLYRASAKNINKVLKYVENTLNNLNYLIQSNKSYRFAYAGIPVDSGARFSFKFLDESGNIVTYSKRLDDVAGARKAADKANDAWKTGGLKWGNPNSKPTYGHTFTEHGAKKTAQQLKDRARALEHQVGQWTNDKQAADFIAKVAEKGEGVHEVILPRNVGGKVFLPDGTEAIADSATIVVKADGSVRTAYPYNSKYKK